MTDDTVIRLTRQQLTETITHHIAWLDTHVPDWRERLAYCCLHCSDIEWGDPMDTLEALYTAWWLLEEEPCGGLTEFSRAMKTSS